MQNSDDVLEAAAHRRDVRRAVVISAVSLALVLATSIMVVIGGAIAA